MLLATVASECYRQSEQSITSRNGIVHLPAAIIIPRAFARLEIGSMLSSAIYHSSLTSRSVYMQQNSSASALLFFQNLPTD
jgi:hypothetical protein